jgi:hypothetical protein
MNLEFILLDFDEDIINDEMEKIWGEAPSNWDNI